MKTKIGILVLLGFAIIACNKGKYTTKPQISFKSISTTILTNPGDELTFNLTFTDKEGDLKDSIWIERHSKVCPDFVNDTFIYKLPDFPSVSKQSGDISITFPYNTAKGISGCQNKTDTSYFRIYVRDNDGNVSDTLTSPDITFNK